MNLKSEPGPKKAQQVKKMRIRALVRKDQPLFQAAVDDVVPAACNVEPQWPGHGQENNPPGGRRNVKCLDVTPGLIAEDCTLFPLLAQAAIDHVVPPACNIEPQWPGHGA